METLYGVVSKQDAEGRFVEAEILEYRGPVINSNGLERLILDTTRDYTKLYQVIGLHVFRTKREAVFHAWGNAEAWVEEAQDELHEAIDWAESLRKLLHEVGSE